MAKKYQPSNGTEGTAFIEKNCMQCAFLDPDPDGERQCETLADTMVFNAMDEEYPPEWTYTAEGKPTCTKRQPWNWEAHGEPEMPTYDPDQLKMF